MIKLSKRLLCIANLISKQDLVIDVGCDHAYLAIYLCNLYKYKKIYVSDINEKALQSGINNIISSKLSTRIISLLGDGISVIDNLNINTLIISGLGAFSIIDIINHPNIKKINKIVIQSNTDHYLIRKYITKLGFIITKEEVVKDNNKYYVTILFERGIKKSSYIKLKYGFHSNLEYYNYLFNQHKKIFYHINFKHPVKKTKELLVTVVYYTIIFKNNHFKN